MIDEPRRSRVARAAAELALVRVVHHYGSRPEFVLLGGLVPDLLCAGSQFVHAGTVDIDVQVDLEIAGGSVNTARLERALSNAEFVPDDQTRYSAIAPCAHRIVGHRATLPTAKIRVRLDVLDLCPVAASLTGIPRRM